MELGFHDGGGGRSLEEGAFGVLDHHSQKVLNLSNQFVAFYWDLLHLIERRIGQEKDSACIQ